MKYNGIITPMITPVNNGKIDYDAIKYLIKHLEKNGIEGIFPGSSTGAFTLFTLNEHKEILEFVAKNSTKIKLLAGISRNNIEEKLEIGKFANSLGYEAAVIITPFYLKFNQEDLYNYYSIIAKNLDMDIFIYNNPELSGNYIEPITISKLMDEYGNIVGIKDSTGDLRKFNLYFTEIPKGKYIFQGRDDLLLPSLILGASGGVCGTSNFSSLIHEIYLTKDLEKHKKIVKAMNILKKYNNSVSYNYLFYKMVMNKELERYTKDPYAPLKELEKNDMEKVIKIFTS